jgi:hypothetical protein
MGHGLRRLPIGAAALSTAATVVVILAGAGPAGAAANTACPAGYQTITVEDAVNEGFVDVAARVDNSGNGDGVVCRRLVGDGALHAFGNPNVDHIYNWLDNVTPR